MFKKMQNVKMSRIGKRGSEMYNGVNPKVMSQERTTLEKFLIVALVICIVITLGFASGLAYYAVSFYTKSEEVCNTAECIKAANDLLESVDTSVDPCENFFLFSCGKWMKNNIIMNGEIDHFTEINDYFLKRVKEMLEEDNDTIAEHFVKAKSFYKACMNATAREDISSFLEDIRAFNGWPVIMSEGEKWNDTDWMDLARIMFLRGYNSDLTISVSVVRDYVNNSLTRIQLDQPTLGLKQKEYYDESIGNSSLEMHAEFMLSMAKAIAPDGWSADDEKVIQEMANAFAIEINLAKMSHPLKFYQNVSNIYHLYKMSEVKAKIPELDWDRYFKMFFGFVIPPEEEIIVSDIAVLQNITRYISHLNSTYDGRRSLANYMVYRNVLETANDLNREMGRIYDDHKNGVGEPWKKCVSSTVENFEISLLSVYQKKYFSEDKRKGILALVGEMKNELADVLKKTSWLDDNTRNSAIEKVRAIKVVAAFPDDFRNDTKVNQWYSKFVVGPNHKQNTLNSNIYLNEKLILSYKKPVDRNDWLYLPEDITDTNAYYVNSENEIFISIGISSDFYYNENNPMYINYGRMGMIIGHELTHSIDQTGALYDSKGNWRNWWKDSTKERYFNESQCLVKLFSNYVDKATQFRINGKQTLVENTADSVGVQEAYHAYIKYSREHKMKSLPALPYTPNQLFWIAYATFWCEKNSVEYLQYLILFDEHPPSNLRVRGVVSNNEGFAKDFQCPVGTPMNPGTERCTIFGH